MGFWTGPQGLWGLVWSSGLPLACCGGAMESNLQEPLPAEQHAAGPVLGGEGTCVPVLPAELLLQAQPPGLGPPAAGRDPHGITDILSRPVALPTAASCPAIPTWPASVASAPRVYSLQGEASTPPGPELLGGPGQDWRSGRQCGGSEYREEERTLVGAQVMVEGVPWQPLNCLGQTLGLSLHPGQREGSPSPSRPGFAWMGILTPCPHPLLPTALLGA